MSSPTFLWYEAIVNRHARIANQLDVEPEVDFAQRMLHLELEIQREGDVASDELALDSFMDRTHELRAVFGGAQ